MSPVVSPIVSVLLWTDADADTGLGAALAATVASFVRQSEPAWELRIAAPTGGVGSALPADSRIILLTGTTETAAGLAGAARGRYLLAVEPGDTLEPAAIGALAAAAPADIVYADEDESDAEGGGRRVVAKPAWSPERLRHGDYLTRMTALRAQRVHEVGGLDPQAGPAAWYDLALRVSEAGAAVVHLPQVLLHRAVADRPSETRDAAVRVAAAAHLRRVGIPATVEPGPVPGSHRVRRAGLPASTSVSLIMPTGWSRAVVRGVDCCLALEAARTLLAGASGADVELVVVHDEPVPDGALDELRRIAGERLVLVPFRSPFNFSAKCNLGFLHSRGDVVVLVNDDIEPISPDWLATLIAPLAEADVAMTGAKLRYEDGTIQHGGHVHTRWRGGPRPRLAWRHAPGDTVGALNSLHVNRETSGVTAACAALRREVFEQAGGLCEELPLNYNDVDLAMKVRRAGRRVLWLAEPELYHFESQSRPLDAPAPHEREFLRRRWGDFADEPYLPWLPV